MTPEKEETKKEKFNRLYGARLKKAIKAIDMLGNCSGVGYEYDMKVVDIATEYLHTRIDSVRNQFTPESETVDNTESDVDDIVSGKIAVEDNGTEEPEV